MVYCESSLNVCLSVVIIVNHEVAIFISLWPVSFWIDISTFWYESWHSSFCDISCQTCNKHLRSWWLRFTPEFFILWPKTVWNSRVLESIAKGHFFLAIPFLTAEWAEDHESRGITPEWVVVGSHCSLIPVTCLGTNDINFKAVLWP